MSGSEAELCLSILKIEVILMVLIDSSGRERSIGCHIVNFDYLNPNGQNLDSEMNLIEPITF